jgi:plastocyanin
MRTAMTTAEGLLLAVVLVFGTIALAFIIGSTSGSQQVPTVRSGVAANQSGTAGSGSAETSLALTNQTTTSRQVGASSPETTFVSILPGSADQVQLSFSPEQVTVVVGVNNTVTWVNNDNAPHTVTADDGSFGSANIGAGGIYTHTFATPGTYKYDCAYHSWMVGTVIVKAG